MILVVPSEISGQKARPVFHVGRAAGRVRVGLRQEVFQAADVLRHCLQQPSVGRPVTDVVRLVFVVAVDVRPVDVRCQDVHLLSWHGFFITGLVASQDDAVNAVDTREGRVSGPVGRDSKALADRLAGTVTRELLGLASKGDVMSQELTEHHGHVGQCLGPSCDVCKQSERNVPCVLQFSKQVSRSGAFAWFALAVGVVGIQQAAEGCLRCSQEGGFQIVAQPFQTPVTTLRVAVRLLHSVAHFLSVSWPRRGEKRKSTGTKKDWEKSGKIITGTMFQIPD